MLPFQIYDNINNLKQHCDMAYMSNCRFEGTASDFGECIEDLKKGKVLNPYEEHYRHTLYEMAKEYITAYENYTPKPDDDEDEKED